MAAGKTKRIPNVPETPAYFGLKYYLKRTVIYIPLGYLLLCALLFVFQRRLIYLPSPLSDSDPAAAGFSPREARNVTLTTADGVRLAGWHVLPAGASAQNAAQFDAALKNGALVDVLFHGNGGQRANRAGFLKDISTLGGHAVCFDYRGYGGSEGEPDEKGLALDARAVWDWLVRDLGLPPERIVLHGESLGCAVAVRLAGELCANGTPPGGVVLEAPFSSLPEAAGVHYWYIPVRLILRERYPSIERIAALSCPLLVFHGRRDRVVPFAQGQRLFEAAPPSARDGTPKRFVAVETAGHSDLRTAEPALYVNALREFFKKVKEKGTAGAKKNHGEGREGKTRPPAAKPAASNPPAPSPDGNAAGKPGPAP